MRFSLLIKILVCRLQSCYNHIALFYFDNFVSFDILAECNDGFHFPNAMNGVEALKAALTVNGML